MQYVKKCIDTNWVSSAGEFVKKFEEAIRVHTKAGHAVACINGTAGLQIALKLCGVKEHDEVIVPTLTFIAPVNAVRYLGAQPVFMDCDDHMNIDPVKLREFCVGECKVTREGLRNKKTGRIVRAVVPVHVFGNPCDMQAIMAIAKTYRLKVIEDATESLGSSYTTGVYKKKFTGTIGDMGVFSFNGNKIITTGGGGMILSANKTLADRARYLIEQAKDDPINYIHHEIGYNYRLTNVQAAIGLAQLKQLKGFIRTKKKNYGLYRDILSDVKGIKMLTVPEGTAPNYWFYSLVVDKGSFGRTGKELMDHLGRSKIQTRPIWFLNHLQRPYRQYQAYRIEKAVKFWGSVLNVPCSSNLKENQVNYIARSIARAARKK